LPRGSGESETRRPFARPWGSSTLVLPHSKFGCFAGLRNNIGTNEPRDPKLFQRFADHPISRSQVQDPKRIGVIAGLRNRISEDFHDSRWGLTLQPVAYDLFVEARNGEYAVIIVEKDLLRCVVGFRVEVGLVLAQFLHNDVSGKVHSRLSSLRGGQSPVQWGRSAVLAVPPRRPTRPWGDR